MCGVPICRRVNDLTVAGTGLYARRAFEYPALRAVETAASAYGQMDGSLHMQVSLPKNVRRIGERQIAFEVDVAGHTVYAEITCEAVLKMQPEAITSALEAQALEKVKASRDIAGKIVEKWARDKGRGDKGLPIFISSIDF